MAARLLDGPRIMGAALCASLVLPVASVPALDAHDGTKRSEPVVRSASSFFLIMGMPSAEAMNLSAWAEALRKRIARQFGADVPRLAGEPILITVRAVEQDGAARVMKGQGWGDGYLEQKLVVYDRAFVDREDILEGLTWLMLNRYVIERQSRRQRAEALGATPDWLAVGVAQHLYPELRARNADALIDSFRHGGRISVSDLLTREHLPPGRWPVKSACGLFYDWLKEVMDDQGRFDKLFGHLAEGGRVTADWLSDTFLDGYEALTLESGWYDWVEKQSFVQHEVGTLTEEHLRKLHELLLVWPDEHGLQEQDGADGILTLGALIEHRGETWVRAFAASRAPALQRLAVGRTKEFSDVVSQYTVFLASMLPPPLPSEQLRVLLENAEVAHAALRLRVRSVDRYLDRVESHRKALDEGRRAELIAFLDRLQFSETPHP